VEIANPHRTSEYEERVSRGQIGRYSRAAEERHNSYVMAVGAGDLSDSCRPFGLRVLKSV
jgi:glycerol dehydrogenase-like iron-containing ADH family enzyme